MRLKKLLIANRGEIAIRIARAAAELGVGSVAVHSADDATCLHVRKADEAVELAGLGAAAYLDIAQLVDAARRHGCDAVHPGYGFLSENVEFARRCEAAGLVFVGPDTRALALFGDKSSARELASRLRVPLLAGTQGPTSAAQAREFLASPESGGAMMIKAVQGGGGRGMCAVARLDDVGAAHAACAAEALAATGCADVYVERLMQGARHLEIQVIGDGTGAVVHAGERECTLQRRHQKILEIAPSPHLAPALRDALVAAALAMAREMRYRSLGTFEFLVDAQDGFAFMEANPRLQVEHTVTEMVSGIDLVKAQLRIAGGETLADMGLTQERAAYVRGQALQLRINMETMNADGTALPAAGTITAFEPPSGPGIRVDGLGYAGYATSLRFDSLLAKLVVHTDSPSWPQLLRKADRALAEFRIEGVACNRDLLHGLLNDEEVAAGRVDTGFLERHLARLLETGRAGRRALYAEGRADVAAPADFNPTEAPPGTVAIEAPLPGTVVSLDVAEGDIVRAGQAVAVLESMKMQHVVSVHAGGVVRGLAAAPGSVLQAGAPILFLALDESMAMQAREEASFDLEEIRPSLAEVLERQRLGLDESRPEAVSRRHSRNLRTARENLAAVLDAGSGFEYQRLLLAAQRSTRSVEDLTRNTPADGIVIEVGTANAQDFGSAGSRCMAMAYDYTVQSGTQGRFGHEKTDRALELAYRLRLPVVMFAEGAGGRPGGESDVLPVPKLNTPTFARMARLSGLVPLVGVVSGNCFGGNAGLLGCCDVIIATRSASFGMGGPAMIEGGGLGIFAASEVGPVSVQGPNGMLDVLVEDEVEAARVARQYLGYFQGAVSRWEACDQRVLRHLVPENRLRVYDVRAIVHALADTDSVLELRPQFGAGMITALIRIEGQPFGLIANNCAHLGGALDVEASDKAARFLQLCDAFDLPVVSLCDTPGFMVGPDAERSGMVRHSSRLFVVGANLSVPFFTIVLRKCYGLGGQAMAGGSLHESVFSMAWPTGEFGGMGIEAAVRLRYKKELESIDGLAAQKACFEELVAREYVQGKALHTATYGIVDDVIDPADTRRRLIAGYRMAPAAPMREGKKRAFVDTW